MNLFAVEKDAQELATSVSRLMGVDVVIVDSELRRIADTFHYPYKNIEIRTNSIIGQIVKTGSSLVVDQKDFFVSCMDCKDRTWCKMRGLMGVPIVVQDKIVGAIGLVIRENNALHLIKNTNLILSFLQQISEMLSNGLTRAENISRYQIMSSQWEHMLNAVDAGVALLDNDGFIIAHNENFCRLFDIEEDCNSHLFTKYVSHSEINTLIEKGLDVDGRTWMFPLRNHAFYGQIQIKQVCHEGQRYGTVVSFQNIYHSIPSECFFHGGEPKKLSLQKIRGDVKLTEALLNAARNDMDPVLLCGGSACEGYLRQVAVAIHEESGRSGKFNYVSGREWLEEVPLAFDPTEIGEIPQAILIAHQGTLCISSVFDLPLIQQRSLLHYLRSSREKREYSSGMRLATRMIFLLCGPLPKADSCYVCTELLEELMPHLIQIPNPLNNQKYLTATLKGLFREYSRVYGKTQLSIEPEAWNTLLAFPWEQGSRTQIHQVVEQLVCGTSGMIHTQQVRQLLEVQDTPEQSVEEFERDKIERLLQEGVAVEQIASILKISRSTLYRRIKKFNLSNKE